MGNEDQMKFLEMMFKDLKLQYKEGRLDTKSEFDKVFEILSRHEMHHSKHDAFQWKLIGMAFGASGLASAIVAVITIILIK